MLDKMRALCLVISVCSLFLLSGCSSWGLNKGGKAGAVEEIKETPSEKEKARLLNKIDHKYERPQAHFKLGQLYQNDGLWVQAENEYIIALNFDPVHRKAQAARVKVLLNIGDEAKSKLLSDIYTEQASSSALGSLKLAIAFQGQALDEYALNCYEQALRLAPNSAKINRQIGYYYLSKGNKVQAQDYLSRSFQLDPSQAEVAGQLGRLGVSIQVPRKITKNTKKLDKTIEQYDKSLR